MTDLTGIFNVEIRKSVSKFSSLRWFLVFEDLYNGEGSLEPNKTSQNIRIYTQNSKYLASKLQQISLISYLSKKKNQFIDLFIFITQKYDDSTTIVIFSKRLFTKKLNAVFT